MCNVIHHRRVDGAWPSWLLSFNLYREDFDPAWWPDSRGKGILCEISNRHSQTQGAASLPRSWWVWNVLQNAHCIGNFFMSAERSNNFMPRLHFETRLKKFHIAWQIYLHFMSHILDCWEGMVVCSGSVVVTAYDSESGRPGLNPEGG